MVFIVLSEDRVRQSVSLQLCQISVSSVLLACLTLEVEGGKLVLLPHNSDDEPSQDGSALSVS